MKTRTSGRTRVRQTMAISLLSPRQHELSGAYFHAHRETDANGLLTASEVAQLMLDVDRDTTRNTAAADAQAPRRCQHWPRNTPLAALPLAEGAAHSRRHNAVRRVVGQRSPIDVSPCRIARQ
jgi:hypothetical protein